MIYFIDLKYKLTYKLIPTSVV